MRSHVPIIAVIALLAALPGGCGRDDAGEAIARVNQRPITQRQLWEYLEKSEEGVAARRALDSLIIHQLLRQEAEKRDIRVAREEIEARLEGMKDYVLASTGKDFASWLEDTGQTETDMMNRMSLQILMGKLVLAPEDREQYFETHKDQLSELPHNSKSVIYRQIIVVSREEADAIYAELTREGGADFAAVAEEKSLDRVTASRGGMVGWLIRGQSDDPALEDVLFALEPGQVSAPHVFQSPTPQAEGAESGQPQEAEPPSYWRIVKAEKRIPAHEMTLEGNANVIEDWMLKEPQFQVQLGQFFSNLRARADVEILSPRYKAVEEAYRREREARDRRLTAAPGGAVPIAPGVIGAPPSAPDSAGPEPGAAEE